MLLARRPRVLALAVLAALALSLTIGGVADGATRRAAVAAIARDAIDQYHLRALMVRVTYKGRNFYTKAFGSSTSGEKASTDMRFRNGAFAFTYMATMMLRLVDRQKVELNDRLAKFLPALPHADEITIRQLLQMTSGYADYVYQDELRDGLYADPFRQWTTDELIRIGVSKPIQFAPGTNWGYSHTNYAILGKVLEEITGVPLRRGLRRYVLKPMHLRHTRGSRTPAIRGPVLHTFSSERRDYLGIPAATPFTEETTFWNPSWTTANGAVETTTIADLTRTMAAVADGKLLRRRSHRAQVAPRLVGFGHRDPGCPACGPNSAARNYGLGVVNMGSWVTQSKSFAGSGATAGALAERKLSIAVVTTYAPQAFDEEGSYSDASGAIFAALATKLAPRFALPSSGS